MASISASETFQQIAKCLYNSNLHFIVTETPYSAQIVIRKRFLSGKTGPASDFLSDARQNKSCDLILVNEELQEKVKNSRENIAVLENRLAESEAKALDALEENKNESSVLKNSLEDANTIISNLKKDLEAKEKDSIEKDKLINKIEHKLKSLEFNNKNLKTELSKVKNENENMIEMKDDELQESNKEYVKLKEKMESLLDILYGCSGCGLCECECNDSGEDENTIPSPAISTQAHLTLSSSKSMATTSPLCPTPCSGSSTWTPPPTPPCSKCKGINFGPSPSSECFACIPPLQDTPQPSSSPPSRTHPWYSATTKIQNRKK